ncbi:Cytochrome P450 1A1 [Araneus ventricosus]|uniref:Cytochrome P450 1A1 n=1 Tax=Araneus ventricosus TaxID=182803 RepID=A0A4Y2WN06_ARAVE|nr:Cytochrome P450 1A1 [Araneus ventricosus]
MRDMIDEYFKERYQRQDENDPSAQYFTDKTLMASLIQFVGDGVLAVASFAGMLTKSLIDHPEEQEKIYEEIRRIIGLGRQPTIEDRSKLTYFNAFIFESMRTADFFNFFPSLECTRETSLSGYRIPKGANTLLNFYCVHNDPELYEEPEKFNPSRFIPVDGKRRKELPILFGAGKRACLGENFTLTQVFLFLTTIVQNFRLASAENPNSSYEQFLNGKLFICAQPRNHES